MDAKNDSETKAADDLDLRFWSETSNGLLADIMKRDAKGRILFVPLNNRSGEHWYRNFGLDYWKKMSGIKAYARAAGEESIRRVFEAKKNTTEKNVYEKTGKALKKCQTQNFLQSSILLFNELVTVEEIRWNSTIECLPCLDGIIDYSGDAPRKREARENEYFRDPLPYNVAEILNAETPRKWLALLSQIHPDEKDRAMARQCMAVAMRGKATKLFQVWFNREGHGGKNTLIDALSVVLPGRVKPISSAVILRGGDSSERRFGTAELEGNLINHFDEVG